MAENNPIDLQLIVLEGGLPAQLPRSLVKAMNDPPASLLTPFNLGFRKRMEAAKASVGAQETSSPLPPLLSVLERGHGRDSLGISWKCSQTRCWLGTLGYAPAILPPMPHQPRHPAPGSSGVSSVLKRDQISIQTQRQPRRLRLGVQAEEREDQCVQG